MVLVIYPYSLTQELRILDCPVYLAKTEDSARDPFPDDGLSVMENNLGWGSRLPVKLIPFRMRGNEMRKLEFPH